MGLAGVGATGGCDQGAINLNTGVGRKIASRLPMEYNSASDYLGGQIFHLWRRCPRENVGDIRRACGSAAFVNAKNPIVDGASRTSCQRRRQHVSICSPAYLGRQKWWQWFRTAIAAIPSGKREAAPFLSTSGGRYFPWAWSRPDAPGCRCDSRSSLKSFLAGPVTEVEGAAAMPHPISRNDAATDTAATVATRH